MAMVTGSGKSGRGVLMIATDVDAADEAEINEWYDREHLPERVAIAGFLCARRYRAITAARAYLALYETEAIDVLDSDDYRRRLANQTARSKRALGRFARPHRAIARITASQGSSVGTAISMTLLPRSSGMHGEELRHRLATQFLPRQAALAGMIAAHLFECDANLSKPLPETAGTAAALAAPDDWIVVAEGSDAASLRTADHMWQSVEFRDIPQRHLGTYHLMSSLSRDDL